MKFDPRRALRELHFFDHGEWNRFPRAFLYFLSDGEAILLAELINIYRMRLSSGEHDNGWVRFPLPTLMKRVPYKEGKIKRLIKSLETKRVILRKMKGMPAKRHMKIMPQNIHTEMDEKGALGVPKMALLAVPKMALLETSSVATRAPVAGRKTQSRNPLKNLLEETVSVSKISKKKRKSRKASHHKKWSVKLLQAVKHVREPNSNSQPSTWPNCFRLLERSIPKQRIEKVLTWYCAHLKEGGDQITNGNPDFVPIAYSAPVFRKKFDGIEGAMHRIQGKQEKDAPAQVPVSRVERDEWTDPDEIFEQFGG